MERRSARYEPARRGASRRTDNAAPPAMKIRAESVPSIVSPFAAARPWPHSPFARRVHRPDTDEDHHVRWEEPHQPGLPCHDGACPQSKKTFRTPVLEGLREPASACGTF